jgi:hypothetical protein
MSHANTAFANPIRRSLRTFTSGQMLLHAAETSSIFLPGRPILLRCLRTHALEAPLTGQSQFMQQTCEYDSPLVHSARLFTLTAGV